ncbi:MAG: flagellar biosynthesis protein FlhF [Bdellovibrionales bacterium]|nr:flagellar biosynthesis protein FlhF [Bdellovibrionales bacterium]
MQVKKFEASTMKEALEMVKQHLGPEAIILSAKENKAGYGLGGAGSVEIAAAVSDLVLQKKKLAEQKMTNMRRESFGKMSATQQKNYIDKVFTKYREENGPKHQMTQRPYISITDEEKSEERSVAGMSVARFEENVANRAASRVQEAAQQAKVASELFVDDEPQRLRSNPGLKSHKGIQDRDRKIALLEKELNMMRKLIQNFQKVPQSFVSLHPGADEGLPYDLGFMYEELTGVGVDQKRTVEILKKAQTEIAAPLLKKKHFVKAWVARHLLNSIEIVSDESLPRYHAFVGGSGQGKTAALVKFASHLVIRRRKNVAIVTCDSKKVGAAEQLRIFAQILNVPFCVVQSPEDWATLHKQLRDVDHLLVDYPANALRTEEDRSSLQTHLPPVTGGRAIHLVQSVLAKDVDAQEIARRYRSLHVSDLIFTGLDETVQHGLIYNVHRESGLPLHSFGIGPQIPEDFEIATKERVVDLLFKLTKVKQERDYI